MILYEFSIIKKFAPVKRYEFEVAIPYRYGIYCGNLTVIARQEDNYVAIPYRYGIYS